MATTPSSAAALAWVASTIGAPVVSVQGLRDGGSPWLLQLDGHEHLKAVVLRTGEPARKDQRVQFETEAAALEVAAAHGVAAPRLLAFDLDGTVAGALAVLATVIPGSSRIPLLPTAERPRARWARRRPRCTRCRWPHVPACR